MTGNTGSVLAGIEDLVTAHSKSPPLFGDILISAAPVAHLNPVVPVDDNEKTWDLIKKLTIN
jgi:hypothetical protein